ncbi:MAG: hypothetical protein HQL35_11750 [Alphaproteobacteria bacterium]|nr:hypothetical protein [Alphaproteobacteria bacterium]
MRIVLVGIIIGIVIGVMIGATVVAPGLEEARLIPEENRTADAPGTPDAPGNAETAETAPADFRIASLYGPDTLVLGQVPERLVDALGAAQTRAVSVSSADGVASRGDLFKALASGEFEAVFAKPEDWDSRSALLQMLSAVPFGPPPDELQAWLIHGGGRVHLENAFRNKGVHPIPCAILPDQGASWHREAVRQTRDLEDLNVAASGLAGDVWTELGARVKTMDPKAILEALRDAELDIAQAGLPTMDAEHQFFRHAQHYYFPAWARPATLYILGVGLKTWKGMDDPAKLTLETACGDSIRTTLAQANTTQFEAMKALGLSGVQIRRLPDPVLKSLRDAWKAVSGRHTQKDPGFAKAWASLHKFRRDYAIWRDINRP